jgi:hypothetical protein
MEDINHRSTIIIIFVAFHTAQYRDLGASVMSGGQRLSDCHRKLSFVVQGETLSRRNWECDI